MASSPGSRVGSVPHFGGFPDGRFQESEDRVPLESRDQFHQIEDDGEVGIHAAGRQNGAARRARHANEPFHLKLLLIEYPGQRHELVRVFRAALVAHPSEFRVGQPAHAEQFADQTAARVRHQVQMRTVRQGVRQRDRIFDRAERESLVLQREYAVVVLG